MAPEGAEPLDVPLHLGITGQVAPGICDVAAAHLLGSPEQIPGDVEHDPRVAALLDQLRDQIGQAAVALGKGLGVVVIALPRVLKHVLEVGDQLPASARRDGRLVHVQRAGKARAQLIELQGRVLAPVGPWLGHGGADRGFLAAEPGFLHERTRSRGLEGGFGAGLGFQSRQSERRGPPAAFRFSVSSLALDHQRWCIRCFVFCPL